MRVPRLPLSLVVALGVHAALASGFYATVRPLARESATGESGGELAIVTEETAPTVETPAARNDEALPAPATSAARRLLGSAESRPADRQGEGAGEPPLDVPRPSASADQTAAGARAPPNLGIGDYWKSVALGPPIAAPADDAPRPSRPPLPTALQLIRDSLSADDHARGLGAAGPLVAAAHEAASPSIAPDVGDALFDVVCDRDGQVVDVHVAGASGDISAWSDVAREIAKTMASKRMHVPHGAAGVRARIRVRAERALPSGEQRAPTPGAVPDDAPGSEPQCAGKGWSRKCQGGMPVGASTTFDISNIGARRSRIVHVQILSEAPL